MFDKITEHECRKTELANAIFFYETVYFFYCIFLIYFYLKLNFSLRPPYKIKRNLI